MSKPVNFSVSKTERNIIRLLSAASLANTSKFVKFDGLNFRKDQLAKLLEIATTIQNFQFSGQLTDGVAMGSSLGFLMANVFVSLGRNALSHSFDALPIQTVRGWYPG